MKSSKQPCELGFIVRVKTHIKQVSLREVKKIVEGNHFSETTAHILASTPQVAGSLEPMFLAKPTEVSGKNKTESK